MANGVTSDELSFKSFKSASKRNSALAGHVMKAALQALQLSSLFSPQVRTMSLIAPLQYFSSPSPPSPSSFPSQEQGDEKPKQSVDLVVHARFIVPVQPHHVLENHSIVVDKVCGDGVGPAFIYLIHLL